MFDDKSEGERLSLEHQVALGPRQEGYHLHSSPSRERAWCFFSSSVRRAKEAVLAGPQSPC